MPQARAVAGIYDHCGWAIIVCVAGKDIIDRRRIELVEAELPWLPHHSQGQRIAIDEAVALAERRALLMVHGGGDRAYRRIQPQAPRHQDGLPRHPQALPHRLYRAGLDRLRALRLPQQAHHPVPLNMAPWLWGRPERFLTRMRKADNEIFAAGSYHDGGFTEINTKEELARLPADYDGGIWTDETEVIGPMIGGQRP